MKSALDYCTVLVGFPIPEFVYQSFDLSDRFSDFHHTLALLSVQQDGFTHTAAWSSCLQVGAAEN